jgi:hypothetical protein
MAPEKSKGVDIGYIEIITNVRKRNTFLASVAAFSWVTTVAPITWLSPPAKDRLSLRSGL